MLWRLVSAKGHCRRMSTDITETAFHCWVMILITDTLCTSTRRALSPRGYLTRQIYLIQGTTSFRAPRRFSSGMTVVFAHWSMRIQNAPIISLLRHLENRETLARQATYAYICTCHWIDKQSICLLAYTELTVSRRVDELCNDISYNSLFLGIKHTNTS